MLDRIKYFLPTIYQNDKLTRSVVQAFQEFTEEINLRMQYEFNQLSASTADEVGIAEWEKELAITPPVDAGLELRRALVRSKLMRLPTVTPERLQRIANQFTLNNTAQVVHIPKSYVIEVRTPIDDILSAKLMFEELDAAKPAHLALYLTMKIIQQIVINYRIDADQVVEAYQNIWNLGALHYVMRNGEFDRDGTIRYGGIYPDEKYKELQSHAAEDVMTVDSWQYHRIGLALGQAQTVEAQMRSERKYYAVIAQIVDSNQAYCPQNKIEAENIVESRQERDCRTLNYRDGSFCRDGSHIRDESFEMPRMVRSSCTVTYMKNGIEVTETL